MKKLPNRSINSSDTNDNNISQFLFHPYTTNELRIPDICNKLHHVYSRVCVFINSVNYKTAEQLIETAEELIATLNKISVEDNSADNQIKLLTEQFSEIRTFLTYLKFIQETYGKQIECCMPEIHQPLLNRTKELAIKNLINMIKFQDMVTEFKSNINVYDISQRKAWIENMHTLATKSFRGAGCSSLRKWARQQLANISANH